MASPSFAGSGFAEVESSAGDVKSSSVLVPPRPTFPAASVTATEMLWTPSLSAPVTLYQLWAFVAPGLYRHESRLLAPFLFFGTLFFLAGGAFHT